MEGLQFRLVECRRQGDVAVLLVNDPPANTLTYDLVRQLEDVFFELELDTEIRAVVLSGAGERFFSGGVNIGMLRSVTHHFNSNFLLYAAEVFERIDASRLLVVAAINGHVTGGGLELALIADKRVAVEGVYNFGFPEVRLGVIPGLGGTQRLSRIVGTQKALELVTHGEFIAVERARHLGVVDEVFPKEDFLARAVDYTRALLAEMHPMEQSHRHRNEVMQPVRALARHVRHGSVAVVTLAEECRDASSLQVLRALNHAILEARLDDDTQAILLTHDSNSLQLGREAEVDVETREYADYVFRRLEGFPRLCVLAFRGALGTLGSELALACDYRLSPEGDWVDGALFSFSSSMQRLARYGIREEGEGGVVFVTKHEADERGLIRMVSADAWPESAINWLSRFVSPRGAAKAIGYAKFAVVQGASLPAEAGMLLERHLQEQLFRGHDGPEGMKAYLEKRAAVFRGE